MRRFGGERSTFRQGVDLPRSTAPDTLSISGETAAEPLYCNVSYCIAIASHHSLIVNYHIEIAAITIRLRSVALRLQLSQWDCSRCIEIMWRSLTYKASKQASQFVLAGVMITLKVKGNCQDNSYI
jgi:hypothetical protein